MPTLAVCVLAYYLAMRLMMVVSGKGAYRDLARLAAKKVTVGL
jgi:hypothetical protein